LIGILVQFAIIGAFLADDEGERIHLVLEVTKAFLAL
jgi:hypothetical protein